MQFLVYLLEVHWLTSPPPQAPPKPAVQTTYVAPVPRPEGPNEALSPVYPKKPEAPESAASPQPPATGQSQTQQAQAPAGTFAATATAETARNHQVETTGTAARTDDTKQPLGAPAGAPTRVDNPQAAPVQPANQTPAVQPANDVSGNRCDVEACASAYKSFRAADCTYQPFDGERRVCAKPPVAARSATREPSAEPAAARRSIRDDELREREITRRARALRDDEDDDNDRGDLRDSERDQPLFLFGSRGRRW